MTKTFLVQLLQIVLIRAQSISTENSEEKSSSNDSSVSSISACCEDTEVYSNNAILDFYYSLATNKRLKRTISIFDFKSLKESAKRGKTHKMCFEKQEAKETGECYKCIKERGKKVFINLYEKKMKYDVNPELELFNLDSKDVFRILKSEIIVPLTEKLEIIHDSEKTNKGIFTYLCSASQQTTKNERNTRLQQIFSLLSAFIFNLNFHNKINSFLNQSDYIDFLDHFGVIKQNTPQYTIIEQFLQHKWQVEDILYPEKNNGNMTALIKQCLEDKTINNYRKEIIHYNLDTKHMLIKNIYHLLKKFATSKKVFGKICDAVDKYSNEAYKKAEESPNGFSFIEFSQNMEELITKNYDAKSELFKEENIFVRCVICIIHPFMATLENTGDIDEYIVLCRRLRKLHDGVIKRTTNITDSVDKANPMNQNLYNNNGNMLSKMDSTTLKQLLKQILISYIISSLKIRDASKNLEMHLSQVTLRVFAEAARIFNLLSRPTDLCIPYTTGNSIEKVQTFCTALSNRIFEEIEKDI